VLPLQGLFHALAFLAYAPGCGIALSALKPPGFETAAGEPLGMKINKYAALGRTPALPG
jgi:hypothetical protein